MNKIIGSLKHHQGYLEGEISEKNECNSDLLEKEKCENSSLTEAILKLETIMLEKKYFFKQQILSKDKSMKQLHEKFKLQKCTGDKEESKKCSQKVFAKKCSQKMITKKWHARLKKAIHF